MASNVGVTQAHEVIEATPEEEFDLEASKKTVLGGASASHSAARTYASNCFT